MTDIFDVVSTTENLFIVTKIDPNYLEALTRCRSHQLQDNDRALC